MNEHEQNNNIITEQPQSSRTFNQEFKKHLNENCTISKYFRITSCSNDIRRAANKREQELWNDEHSGDLCSCFICPGWMLFTAATEVLLSPVNALLIGCISAIQAHSDVKKAHQDNALNSI